jgi:hypothetical protein
VHLSKSLLVLAFLSLSAAPANASPLICVQRAIDWNNAAPSNQVRATIVANHDVGVVAFAGANLVNSGCAVPASLGGCLSSFTSVALLSDRNVQLPPVPGKPSNQPFSIRDPLPFQVDALSADSGIITRFRSGGTTYDLLGQCIGNMLVGNDQWGNHWTISLQLIRGLR